MMPKSQIRELIEQLIELRDMCKGKEEINSFCIKFTFENIISYLTILLNR